MRAGHTLENYVWLVMWRVEHELVYVSGPGARGVGLAGSLVVGSRPSSSEELSLDDALIEMGLAFVPL